MLSNFTMSNISRVYLFLSLCSIISGCYAQENTSVSGTISGGGKKLVHIKITNLKNGNTRYSDEDGKFDIRAQKNDSLLFSSGFFKEQIVKVRSWHFREELNIEMTEKVNELEEVIVTDTYIAPDFDEKTYSNGLQKQIAEDMKNDPLKYMTNTTGNIDFVLLFKLVQGLFKKNKVKEAPPQTIDFEDLDHLFTNDTFFTEQFLTDELKIPEDRRGLFLVYCEAQEIDAELLMEDQRFELLNELILHSQEFLYTLANTSSGH